MIVWPIGTVATLHLVACLVGDRCFQWKATRPCPNAFESEGKRMSLISLQDKSGSHSVREFKACPAGCAPRVRPAGAHACRSSLLHKAPDPVTVGPLRVQGVVLEPHPLPHLFLQAPIFPLAHSTRPIVNWTLSENFDLSLILMFFSIIKANPPDI